MSLRRARYLRLVHTPDQAALSATAKPVVLPGQARYRRATGEGLTARTREGIITMGTFDAGGARIAIGCLSPDISGPYREIHRAQIRDLAQRLNLELAAIVDLDISAPESAVFDAIRRAHAEAAIVPELRHLQPVTTLSTVQKMVQVVTIAGERALAHGVYENPDLKVPA
jgi:hypothetical protein